MMASMTCGSWRTSFKNGTAVRAVPTHGEGAPFHPCSKGLRRARGQETAFVQQKDVVAAFGLVQICGGPKHAHPIVDEGVHDVPELAPRYGIDADAGFIE